MSHRDCEIILKKNVVNNGVIDSHKFHWIFHQFLSENPINFALSRSTSFVPAKKHASSKKTRESYSRARENGNSPWKVYAFESPMVFKMAAIFELTVTSELLPVIFFLRRNDKPRNRTTESHSTQFGSKDQMFWAGSPFLVLRAVQRVRKMPGIRKISNGTNRLIV